MIRRLLLTAATVVAVTVTNPTPLTPVATAAPGPTSAFQAVAPCRLLDTRGEGGAPLAANATTTIPTAGRCGLPAGASALAVSITVTQPAAAGYVTLWPGGGPRPTTSTVNFVAGETRANGAIIATGADGSLALASSADAHVVVDVTGAFTPATTATAGRFVAVPPRRLLDTRDQGQRLGAGTSVTIPLPEGVPSDAVALAVTIATSDSTGAGFFTAHPTGTARPGASSLNTDGIGQVRATGQIVPVSAAGFTVFSQSGEHLIVDWSGWFTGPSAPASADGLFVPTTPTRLTDTRGGAPVYPGGAVSLDPTSITGGPVAAIAANFTLTRTWRGGYLTVHPSRTAVPLAATVNADRRAQTVAQFGIAPASTDGLAAFSSGGSHLVVDVTGWFTGAPQPTTLTSGPVNNPVADTDKRVLLMGDSTLAGVRWYTNSQHALGGSNFVLDAESCRRLVGLSCRGREGRSPPNAVDAINAHGGSFDVVVIMTGYNDWYTTFDAAFEATVAAARGTGATDIIWLTYREGSAYRNPTGGTAQDQGFRIANEILREKVASGRHPDVHIADWNAYTQPTSGWFTSDGVHFTIAGAYGAADYISRYVASLRGEPCPAPWAPGAAIGSPCSNPDAHAGQVDPFTIYAGNPNDVHCYEVGTDRHVECRVDPKLAH